MIPKYFTVGPRWNPIETFWMTKNKKVQTKDTISPLFIHYNNFSKEMSIHISHH